MDRTTYLRLWLRALSLKERLVLGPIARERNRFIKAVAAQYAAHQIVPTHAKEAHKAALQKLLMQHYQTVMPYFGALAAKPVKARHGRIETKAVPRHVFHSSMMEWAYSRSLTASSTISDTDSDDVQDSITKGLDEGLGVAEIASAISDVTGLTSWRAATVARTETHAAATYGAITEAQQTADEIGTTLVKQWLPTLDDRTRPEHAAMADSEPIPLDDKFIVGGEEMDRPGDPAGSAENTINCLHPDTILESGRVLAMTRHWYEGTLITIETESGNKLSVTPNHPVLTVSGWRTATSLNKTDSVVSGRCTKGVLLKHFDVQHIKATAKQVYDTLSVVGVVVGVRRINVDFHGDLPNSDVDVVRPECQLRNSTVSALLEPLKHLRLACADLAKGRLLAYCLLNGVILMELPRRIANYFVSILSMTKTFLGWGVRHTRIHALASISGLATLIRETFQNVTAFDVVSSGEGFNRLAFLEPCGHLARNQISFPLCGNPSGFRDSAELDAALKQPVPNSTSVDANSPANLRHAEARGIFADKIIDIHHTQYSGYVYNLETESGYYTGNGIIQHNCRCAINIVEASQS